MKAKEFHGVILEKILAPSFSVSLFLRQNFEV